MKPTIPKGLDSDDAIAFKSDLSKPEAVDELFNTPFGAPTITYCLHGIMSRGAEDNFDLGMKINIDSIRLMLERARKSKEQTGKTVKFIFTSSIAVFGGPLVSATGQTEIQSPD